MGLKGTIAPDHISINKYQLIVAGLPTLTPTKIGGFPEELDAVEIPDRTRASGGNTKPIEFTMTLPAHHDVEVAAMEMWFQESQDPVLPTYKNVGTLLVYLISGQKMRTVTLTGLFPTRIASPDLDMANEGEMMTYEYTLSADDAIRI